MKKTLWLLIIVCFVLISQQTFSQISFTNAPNTIFGVDFYYGDTQLGDFDGDGDLDFIIAREKGSYPYSCITRIITNENGTFSEENYANIPDVLKRGSLQQQIHLS